MSSVVLWFGIVFVWSIFIGLNPPNCYCIVAVPIVPLNIKYVNTILSYKQTSKLFSVSITSSTCCSYNLKSLCPMQLLELHFLICDKSRCHKIYAIAINLPSFIHLKLCLCEDWFVKKLCRREILQNTNNPAEACDLKHTWYLLRLDNAGQISLIFQHIVI